MHITKKKIVLGVTGSIAAYKSALLVRLLKKAGAQVQVVMTDAAQDFISDLTLSTLSGNPIVQFFTKEDGTWNNHIELGLWADLIVIAPASANTIAKMAHGLCDNMLLATYLSAKCPVWVAPAMDLDMFVHPSTKENLKKLEAHGCTILTPANGELASGLVGQGRMQEPEAILLQLEAFFKKELTLLGKHFLITAGPTFEKIDPVRYIGNFSSGKMGFELAREASNRGAEVTLVAGPVNLDTPKGTIKRINVQSADEMFEACKTVFPQVDVVIKAAAVADFKPANFSAAKLKKKGDTTIQLSENKDILTYLGTHKSKGQYLVGFALENQQEDAYAINKIQKKHLDLIVLNSLNDPGAGFGVDTNKVTLIHKDLSQKTIPLLSKKEVAALILNEIEAKL